jgi:hypothetical protein
MKKLIIAVLLAATTQAQAAGIDAICNTLTSAIAYATVTEAHCGVVNVGLSDALTAKYEKTGCSNYSLPEQQVRISAAKQNVADLQAEKGARICEPLVKSYTDFLRGK